MIQKLVVNIPSWNLYIEMIYRIFSSSGIKEKYCFHKRFKENYAFDNIFTKVVYPD